MMKIPQIFKEQLRNEWLCCIIELRFRSMSASIHRLARRCSMERLDFRKPFSALPKLKKVSMAKESMCFEGSEGFLRTNNNLTTFRSCTPLTSPEHEGSPTNSPNKRP